VAVAAEVGDGAAQQVVALLGAQRGRGGVPG